MAESAADSEVVIRPNAVNKWEGEDDDEDVKVRIPMSRRDESQS